MQDWTNVVENGPTDRQFLRPTWFRAWDIAYGDDRNWRRPVRYLSLSRGPSHCVLPLATQWIGPFRFASLCGTFLPFRGVPHCGNPVDLATQTVETLSKMRAVAGVRLGPMSTADSFLTALAAEYARAGWNTIRREFGAEFVLDNPGSAEQFAAQLSSKRRQKIDYYWRKLGKQGPTELRHFNGGAATDWCNVLRDLRTVEAASWVAELGEPRFLGFRNEIFWDLLTADEWFRQAIHAWIIYHAGEAVSFALALDAGITRYVFANSFDARVAEYRTGTKVYQQMIYDAFSRGLKRINFGLGDSGYKFGWGARATSTLVDAVAFLPTALGSVAYLAARAKELATRLRQRKTPQVIDDSEASGESVPSNREVPPIAASDVPEVVHAE